MDEYQTVSVVVMLPKKSRQLVSLTRVPIVGEFIHIKDKPPGKMVQVLAVTHLAWREKSKDNVAEIWCKPVKESLPGKVSSDASKKKNED